MVSASGQQRIVLTVQRVNYEGYELPCNFAAYIEEEIQQVLEQLIKCQYASYEVFYRGHDVGVPHNLVPRTMVITF